MHAASAFGASDFYSALATAILLLHALFILWVIFGALLTRSRPLLRWLHIASLLWESLPKCFRAAMSGEHSELSSILKQKDLDREGRQSGFSASLQPVREI